MAHRKFELLDNIVRSINECGWNVLYVSDIASHPFLIKIYDQYESYLLRIYVWYLTHGGGFKRPKDEYRIQITGVDKFVQLAGENTLILGWWLEANVFAGFDYFKHNGKLGASPSIQIREDSLRKAHINGMSPCDRGNGEIAIAFRPDFFVDYVKNLRGLHDFGKSQKDYKILEKVTEAEPSINEELIVGVTPKRQTTLLQLTKKIRDNSFKKRVLNAYSYKCAICELQLKLVDAAHILPVENEASTDNTSNGLSLCPLHHRAYDRALITIDEKYRVFYNKGKMKNLKEIGHDRGMEKFITDMRPYIILPPSVSERPHLDYIKAANKLRGWKL